MQRISLPILTCVIAVLAACAELPSAAHHDGAGAAAAPVLTTTGNHLVMYNVSRLPADFATVIASHGGSVVAAYDPVGIAVVEGMSDEAAAALAAHGNVHTVSPDYLIPLNAPAAVAVEAVPATAIASPLDPAAALFFPRQWNMRAIAADQAWAAGMLGSPDVTVAILDTGIGYTHPDLVNRVDLARSASFIPAENALVDLLFPGAHHVADLHWHGTHVAATVASNGFLAAGVTSMATLMGVKVCDVSENCPTNAILAGILYAADNGADVINLSLGGYFLRAGAGGFGSVLNRVFNYASQRGAVIVVAAGNEAVDLDRNVFAGLHFPSLNGFPCDGATTVCVSATGPAAAAGVNGPWTGLDTFAEYSNFGRSAIDVAAPGGRGGVTGNGGLIWAACSHFSLVVPPCQVNNAIIGSGGTSMASPHVAGVAALLVEQLGRNPGRIRAALHNTADDVGAPGTDPLFGKGRVNAARAAGL